MLKTRDTITAIVAILFVAGTAFAAISGSNHDFTSGGSGAAANTSPEICGPCHVPHKPKQNVPLWSHTPTASTFLQYDTNPEYSSGNEAAYDGGGAAHDFAGSLTLACLSCHDGTLAANQAVTLTSANAWILWDDGAAVAGGANSTGLMGSHPVGLNYVTVQTAHPSEYDTAANLASTPVVLEGGTHVQCTSCHNAHNVAASMLVEANTASALCLRCHTK